MKDKDIDKLRNLAKEQGWRISKRGRGGSHEQWYSPDGKTIVSLSSNKTTPKGFKNMISELRRNGLKGI